MRIVLTGGGGGAWTLGGSRTDTGPGVRIVADAEGFCRLAARRIAPEALEVDVAGDRALAGRVLAAAAVLAA